MDKTLLEDPDPGATGFDAMKTANSDNKPLAQSAASGLAYMTLLTILTKLATMVGQVVLAWLLLPSAFGLVGVSSSVTAIIGLVQDLGLLNVLVNRQKRFSLWAKPVFWMSLTVGLTTGLLMAFCAPIAARIYGMPEITGLILVVALASPLTAVGLVPMAFLRKQLRFKTLMVVGVIQNVGQVLLSILFAWMGAEAYSFVLPQPIIAALVAAVLWYQAPVTIGWRLHLRKWRYLVTDSLILTLGRGCYTLISKGGYVVLGLLYTSTAVGIYYFAFNLSLQFISLLTGQLVSVLFPVLARMQGDAARQYRAFNRVLRLIATVTVPAALLQAATSDPLIRLIFDERWYPSIPVTQLLCVGMAIASVGFSNEALLFAQRRFKVFFFVGLIGLALFFPLALIGSFLGAEMGVAIGVTAHQIVLATAGIYLTIRPLGGTMSDIVKLYRVPVPLAVVSILPVWLFTMTFPASILGYLARLVTIVGVSSVSYWWLLGRFDPESRKELLIPLDGLLGPKASALLHKFY